MTNDANPPATQAKPIPAGANPAWIENHHNLGAAVAFFVVLLYVTPVFIIAGVAWWTEGFQQDSFWFAWFAAFMQSADSTLNQFHKVLLPIISAISVVAFRGEMSKPMLALGAFIMLAFIVTVFVAVVFDMESTKAALKGLKQSLDMRLVQPFFTRVEEALMMYFMLLFGIGINNKLNKGTNP